MQVAAVCWSVLVRREALPENDNLMFTAVAARDEYWNTVQRRLLDTAYYVLGNFCTRLYQGRSAT